MLRITLIIILIMILIIIFFLAMKNTEESINLVFIDENTKKYHQEKCSCSKNLRSIILEIAIKDGYTPCKICNEENT